MVPAMVYLLRFSQHQAHGTSLTIMITLAAVSTFVYAREGAVYWIIALTLIPGGMIGAYFGARFTQRIMAAQLKKVFAVFVFATGVRMLWASLTSYEQAAVSVLLGAKAACGGLAIGLASGFLAGVLGVGGGIIMVPAMSLLLGIGQHAAQGTSLAAIVPTAVSGARTHAKMGNVDLRAAVGLAIGGIPGGIIGSCLANHLDQHTLKGVFGGFLLMMSIFMLLKARTTAR